MTPMALEARALRDIVAEFVQEVLDGSDEIRTTDLVEHALSRFESDEEFARAVARDVISVVVPEVLRSIVHRSKRTMLSTPSGVIRRDSLEKTARERLSRVFEGTGGGYRSILDLNKSQLLTLNERDAKQITGLIRWVDFRADLASQMDDSQVVRDLPSGVLTDLWGKHLDD